MRLEHVKHAAQALSERLSTFPGIRESPETRRVRDLPDSGGVKYLRLVSAVPERDDRWSNKPPWESSAFLPAVAGALLAALWVLTAFAGWALAAFCAPHGAPPAPACGARIRSAVELTGAVAAVAVGLTASAWIAPRARRDPALRARLLGAAVVAWVLAEGLLFILGKAA